MTLCAVDQALGPAIPGLDELAMTSRGGRLGRNAGADHDVGRLVFGKGPQRLQKVVRSLEEHGEVVTQVHDAVIGDLDSKYLPIWQALRSIGRLGWGFLGAFDDDGQDGDHTERHRPGRDPGPGRCADQKTSVACCF